MRSPQVSKPSMIITEAHGLPQGLEQQQSRASGPMPSAAVTAAGGFPLRFPSALLQDLQPLRSSSLPITSPNSPRKAKAHPKGQSTTLTQPSSLLLKRQALHGLPDVHDEGGQRGKEKNRLLALTEGTPRAPRIFLLILIRK